MAHRLTPPAEPQFLASRDGGGGLSRKQVRHVRFDAPFRGARLDSTAADDPIARARLALLATRHDIVLSDVSAAFAWGLPLPPWIELNEGPLSLAAPAETSRTELSGVRGRRLALPDDHLTELQGMRLTTPARTWLDCAQLVPLPHLIAMGDALLRRDYGTLNDLELITRWARRRRGVVNARVALPLLNRDSASPGESLARAHLVLAKIPMPECNRDIFDEGQWLACVDMVWRSQRLIVEYDGIVHLEERQRQYDAIRRNLLTDAGWTVLVFTAADLRHPHRMCELVRSALHR